MAGETKEKKEEKKEKKPKAEAKAPEAEDKKAKAAAEAPAKAPPAPHAPADPRMKVLKKLRGKMLPKGELRERLKAVMDRWHSGPDHGGVSVAELEGLLDAWQQAKASAGPRTK